MLTVVLWMNMNEFYIACLFLKKCLSSIIVVN